MIKIQNPDNVRLYHITHATNLSGIIEAGGLWSDNACAEKGISSLNIGYSRLKARRLTTPVPLRTGKYVGDYVPLYFANRMPMLYAISQNQVVEYSGEQREIIYLVTTIGDVLRRCENWLFTDGHAVESISGFYNDLADLEQLDWNLVEAWSWRNTTDDNDRKRRKQAEFLVEKYLPWECINKIAVYDEIMVGRVKTALAGAAHCPEVCVESKWYY
ncbi:MAG: DUF4433 domain-containing protein [Bacillota bacterium]